MSRFYGEMWGRARTAGTRIGTDDDPIVSHTRGWNVGARVECFADDDVDIIQVYATRGSNHPSQQALIATLRYNPNGKHYSVFLHKEAENYGR